MTAYRKARVYEQENQKEAEAATTKISLVDRSGSSPGNSRLCILETWRGLQRWNTGNFRGPAEY